jgi:hypothetical protein
LSPTIPIVTVLEVKRKGGAGPPLKWSPLLEPVRPWVDQWVWRLANSGQLSPDQFAYSQAGGCRLDKEARTVFFGEWHAVEAWVAPTSATGA